MAKRIEGQRVGRARSFNDNLPKGEWRSGIGNPEIAAMVGQFIVALPYIEESLVPFFGRLILLPSASTDVARQVLRSIRTAEGKISAMSAVLQNSFVHAGKPDVFDQVIKLYDKIRDKRNTYAHGLWSTHENGRVYVVRTDDDVLRFNEANRREVTKNEIKEDLKRVDELMAKIGEAAAWEDRNPIPHGKRRMTMKVRVSEPQSVS
ncbi:hypothetical protein IVA95_15395 [Bradyrhizobium sp. 157]|uniref:hypothetical protein n=1 Tax=Bradyrhizobium sp. 157 TaxID=2782631 RepID=UPI001FFA348E|nr:hypothetical protein [Bradyrhizobium sp. 157]MCK1638948.1 hypothetical protein [Bradyrhizobium sp. 157]